MAGKKIHLPKQEPSCITTSPQKNKTRKTLKTDETKYPCINIIISLHGSNVLD